MPGSFSSHRIPGKIVHPPPPRVGHSLGIKLQGEPQNQCSGSRIRCLFAPGSGKGFFRIPDPGSPAHISWSSVKKFWLKSTKCFVTWPKHFCTVPYLFKNIYFKFCDISGYKKTTKFSPLTFSFCRRADPLL
jgi:hypothetical protein